MFDYYTELYPYLKLHHSDKAHYDLHDAASHFFNLCHSLTYSRSLKERALEDTLRPLDLIVSKEIQAFRYLNRRQDLPELAKHYARLLCLPPRTRATEDLKKHLQTCLQQLPAIPDRVYLEIPSPSPTEGPTYVALSVVQTRALQDLQTYLPLFMTPS